MYPTCTIYPPDELKCAKAVLEFSDGFVCHGQLSAFVYHCIRKLALQDNVLETLREANIVNGDLPTIVFHSFDAQIRPQISVEFPGGVTIKATTTRYLYRSMILGLRAFYSVTPWVPSNTRERLDELNNQLMDNSNTVRSA